MHPRCFDFELEPELRAVYREIIRATDEHTVHKAIPAWQSFAASDPRAEPMRKQAVSLSRRFAIVGSQSDAATPLPVCAPIQKDRGVRLCCSPYRLWKKPHTEKHAYSPAAWETEAGESLEPEAQDQPGLKSQKRESRQEARRVVPSCIWILIRIVTGSVLDTDPAWRDPFCFLLKQLEVRGPVSSQCRGSGGGRLEFQSE